MASLSGFLAGMIEGGHVASDAVIEFARIAKNKGRVREGHNPFTGEKISIPLPSRAREKPRRLANSSDLIGIAADQEEFDVMVAGEGIPASPPLRIGFDEGNGWKAFEGEQCCMEVACCVRSNIVRLYLLESEDDLHRPPDFAAYRPRYDEDCTTAERDGLFVHPELGAIRISNAGCAMFWIEFNYGKFVYPRANGSDVNVLSGEVVRLARSTFGTDFVQACDWG
jgi:hypothetical protein